LIKQSCQRGASQSQQLVTLVHTVRRQRQAHNPAVDGRRSLLDEAALDKTIYEANRAGVRQT
jgi:hypothetical protein